MLSVGRPDNTSVRTGFSSLIRLTRSDNYIKCNKKTCLSYINNDMISLFTMKKSTFNFSALNVVHERFRKTSNSAYMNMKLINN